MRGAYSGSRPQPAAVAAAARLAVVLLLTAAGFQYVGVETEESVGLLAAGLAFAAVAGSPAGKASAFSYRRRASSPAAVLAAAVSCGTLLVTGIPGAGLLTEPDYALPLALVITAVVAAGRRGF